MAHYKALRLAHIGFQGLIGKVWRNRLFLQAFLGGRDRCGIFGKSHLISSAYVLYRVCKTLESNMSLLGYALPFRSVDHRRLIVCN